MYKNNQILKRLDLILSRKREEFNHDGTGKGILNNKIGVKWWDRFCRAIIIRTLFNDIYLFGTPNCSYHSIRGFIVEFNVHSKFLFWWANKRIALTFNATKLNWLHIPVDLVKMEHVTTSFRFRACWYLLINLCDIPITNWLKNFVSSVFKMPSPPIFVSIRGKYRFSSYYCKAL